MSLVKNICVGVMGAVAGVGLFGGSYKGAEVVYNFSNYDNVLWIEHDGTVVARKVDGLFGNTQVILNPYGGITIDRDSGIRILDENGDGLVDRIGMYIGSGSTKHYESYTRDEDFDTNRALFKKADRELIEQQYRFRTLLKGES